ncbi:transposase [Streptomyces milbemycinicus]|uniref:Transposase n=1 Tax=Streptomyces milbemycinicus TaxID=476552 RepID=A0ABW8LVV6_9ACTN
MAPRCRARAFVLGLVVDETGDLKKGAAGSVGVQRQYIGTTGRIDNSQLARRVSVSRSGR